MTKAFLHGCVIAFCLATFVRPSEADAPSADTQGSWSIATALQPFVDAHELAGAVTLVADKNQVLSVEAVGFADVEAKKPMRTHDLFWIASMSKGMTATALMMLVDEGKVSVDDPVEKYLPEFSGPMVEVGHYAGHILLKKPDHPIKIREILSHTSGLPFISPPEESVHHIDTMPLRSAVMTYAQIPLTFEPGTEFHYSNAGINTAGRIIEIVSGMPYEKFMQERLFTPLGMKDTTFFPLHEQLQRLAESYKPGPLNIGLKRTDIGQLSYPLDGPNRYPCPAGGLFSTAADVGQFCQMLLNGGTLGGKRYISAASLQQMTSTQTGQIMNKGHGEEGYGFGFFTSRYPRGDPMPGSGGIFQHGGAYSTNMEIDPIHQRVTVFLVQQAGFPGNDGNHCLAVFERTAAELFGR
jgi:CubicO group peptidase (beta-lactamase class C family)